MDQLIDRTSLLFELDTYWPMPRARIRSSRWRGGHRLARSTSRTALRTERQAAGHGKRPCPPGADAAAALGLPVIVESETLTPDGVTEAELCIKYLQSLRKPKGRSRLSKRIGTDRIRRHGRLHIRQLRTMPEINIAGVYDIAPERMEAARRTGSRYAALEALLEDESVDFVTIATPNDTHRPLAIRAMECGKHVISEKPVCVSSEDLQAMIDASRQYKRLFTVHQNRRWTRISSLSGSCSASARWAMSSPSNPGARLRGIPGDWRNTKRQGGGMIWIGAFTCSTRCSSSPASP
jgi:hypothetical protein